VTIAVAICSNLLKEIILKYRGAARCESPTNVGALVIDRDSCAVIHRDSLKLIGQLARKSPCRHAQI
jgi:hypothetical protein